MDEETKELVEQYKEALEIEDDEAIGTILEIAVTNKALSDELDRIDDALDHEAMALDEEEPLLFDERYDS